MLDNKSAGRATSRTTNCQHVMDLLNRLSICRGFVVPRVRRNDVLYNKPTKRRVTVATSGYEAKGPKLPKCWPSSLPQFSSDQSPFELTN